MRKGRLMAPLPHQGGGAEGCESGERIREARPDQIDGAVIPAVGRDSDDIQ